MLIIESQFVPTATQLKEAQPFSHFDARLDVVLDEPATAVLGKKYYQVMKSFRYYLSEHDRDTWAYVPAGFLTDGASVPRPFWWILPPWGSYGQAAVLHDILCESGQMYRNDIPVEVDRKEADHIFRDAMKAAGVGWLARNSMFLAVRAWGVFGWKPNKKRLLAKRALETDYMKMHGTYREPTAILRQVSKAIASARAAAVEQAK